MTKKQETKEIAVAKDELANSALAIQEEAKERAAALQDLGVESDDLVIPLIQVMQNTSALVGDEKAKLGDIVNMSTEEVIGGVEKPIKVLPLKLFKTLRVYNVGDGFKFKREEPLTAKNEKLAGEGKEDGEPVKYYPTFNFFVLLKSDLDKDEGFPSLIRFKSTGMPAGRSLATHLYKRVMFKKKPYSQFVELSSKKDKKETNTYAVPVVGTKNLEEAGAAALANAEGWLAMLAAGKYKVAETEDSAEDTQTVHSGAPTVVDAEVVPGGEF